MTVTTSVADSLRQHGIHATAQRLAVFAAVVHHPHSSADDLVEIARRDIGTISRQAVYDAVSVFVEKGLLRRIQPVGSPARYEDRVNDNHHHLICRICGDVVDVDCAVGSAPCLVASDDQGYEIDEADVAYWGRCPQCQARDLVATRATPAPRRRRDTSERAARARR